MVELSLMKKTASVEIKQRNRSNIYHLLRKHDGLSRQDIVNALQLSLPTVAQNLLELKQDGLVAESGFIGNTGGRSAKVFSTVSDAGISIGVDITRNHITTVAIDLNGTVVTKTRNRVAFERSESYYRRLGEIVEETVSAGNLDREKVLGVGIGVPGLITADHQTVFYGEILNVTGAKCDEFAQFIDLPVALFNDANAAAFAEMWTNPDISSAFYVMLSNNVGGAIYNNHRQFCGENMRAGEVGHVIIVPDGLQCYCGQRGCVDAYCAATVLSNTTNGSLKLFFEKLRNGDKSADLLWYEYLRHLAKAIINVRMLFDLPVIIGGYVGEYIDDYLPDLRAFIAGKNSFEDNADYILPCRYKIESIATGAALYYIDEFLNKI
jgi:predicted NBD/HSP70 family sugar kinase